jgi:acetylornithine deacetylase/succinyl-diaminopimelate desuccinylase-like protein
MIVASNEIAREYGGLASTGIIRSQPGSVNTVPGSVSFSLDLRAAKDETVGLIEAEAKMRFKKIASGAGITGACKVEWIVDQPNNAINFHEDCIGCVEKSTEDTLGKDASDLSMHMVSGAGVLQLKLRLISVLTPTGHDSVYTSVHVPTSMIFVPCHNGVSHNPQEYCAPEDCALGTQVLLGAVMRYDELRASRATA